MDAVQPSSQHPAHPMTVDSTARVVSEAPRCTPISADVEVLVVGGGPAGVGAALAAARSGARTMLLERHGMLGGVWTAGLLNPLFDATGKGWLVAELIARLEAAGAWRRWKFSYTFDTEAMKLLLEQMMAEAGVELLYYCSATDTIVEDGVVRGVVVESKAGREAILADVTIDCSGDGDVAARAGVPYRLGRAHDGLCQPMTLMFSVSGVGDFEQRDTATLYDAMNTAAEQHGLATKLPYGRVNYAPWIINTPAPDTAVVQATHVYQMNPLSSRDLTRATLEARQQAHDWLRLARRVPGLERLRLSQSAPSLGVREARRIEGRYTLDLADLQAGRTFPDAVTHSTFCVDIHDVAREGDDRSLHHTPMKPFEIPYRALLPVGVQRLLVAGRCISGTHEAHASYRVTGTCMAMGQAAGLAAAMAVQNHEPPDRIDTTHLREALLARGVGLLESRHEAALKTR